jgi:RNase P protein component
MADVAGLVLSVVSLWKICVEVFEAIDSGRNYGMDYELLRVKLEVERIRLHSWGDAIGLGEGSDNAHRDPRLERGDVVNTAMRVLGCIHHLFENSERLQNTYGLQPSTVDTTNMLATPQGQPILGAVFKKAYESLRKNARERHRATRMVRKSMWVIKDKQKFQAMIVEIKGFNDNLESLFPGSKARIAEAMREDVESSASMEELQLLQDATAQEHGDMSGCASARLEVLGAPSTARTELLTVQGNLPEQDGDWEDVEDEEDANDGQTARAVDPEMTELEKKMGAIKLYCKKKREGALTLRVEGPQEYSAKVTTYCYWGGETEGNWWVNRDKGFVKSFHASFGKSFAHKDNNVLMKARLVQETAVPSQKEYS